MKCPKCNYVSHDYLDDCRKCGIDLVPFKQDIGLLVLQPGVLDLSLVLGGAGADSLFESVEEGVTLHASDDDDFDISLDDYTEHAGTRRSPAGAPRSGRPETETDLAGMDHLTLELDASELPPEMTARLRAAQVISGEPPTTPTQPPAEPGAITLPGHLTLEIEPENISSELPPAILQNLVPSEPPPPQNAPESLETQDVPARQLDVSHVDLAHRTPTDTPKTKSLDEAEAESVDEAVSVADFSGTLASLPLQDVVLAEDTPMASAEPAPEVVEPTLPTIELLDATTTLAQTDAARRATPEETEEAMGLIRDSVELSVDDSVLSIASDEPSGSEMADVIEPAITPCDDPHQEATGLLPSLEFDLSTLAEAEVLPSDLTGPARHEAPFTDADEAGPRPPSVSEWTPTDAETPPEGLLTSSDMFALENLEDPIPPEHLTLELEPPVLPADLASGVLEDAPQTPLPAVTEIPELRTSASTEPGLPVGEAVSFEDLDDIALPGHLTLELDSSDMASEVSSIILDNLQPENPPGDIQSRIPPHDDQADDEPELLLDLDGLELGDDEPA
jgi:hypothetical protein